MEEIQKAVQSQLQALESMSGINSNLEGFGSAIGTVTTEYGQNSLHEIEDIPDTDHIFSTSRPMLSRLIMHN